MFAWIVSTGRVLRDRHRLTHCATLPRLEIEFGALEHLGAGGAVRFDKVHSEIDQGTGWPVAWVVYVDLDRDLGTDRKRRRTDGHRGNFGWRTGSVPKHIERIKVRCLDQGAQPVTNESTTMAITIGPPPASHLDDKVGMILGDVIQVVRNRSAYVLDRVILEFLEQHNHGTRVLLELLQPERPRQPGPGAFAHEPTYVDVGITRPYGESVERGASGIAERCANAELAGGPFGDLI